MSDHLSPEPLLRWGTNYWAAKAFLVACDHKLFTLLDSGPKTAAAVAEALGRPPRGTRLLLDGMAALGALDKQEDRYCNTPLSAAFLVEGKPLYMGDFFIGLNRLFYDIFADFDRAWREDRPVWSVDAAGRHIPLSGADSELFVRAMHGWSAWVGQRFGESQFLNGKGRLLDLGGGSGAMSIGAAQRHPELLATVFDRPAVCAVAGWYIAQAGLAGRIKTLAGDIFTDDYPPGLDVHLYSNLFHNFEAEHCRHLLRKSWEALPPGGTLIIVDLALDETQTAPALAAWFNFLALLVMKGGEARPYSQYRDWLAETGFTRVQQVQLSSWVSMITATRP